jgi:YVTN family beta-propeller protein
LLRPPAAIIDKTVPGHPAAELGEDGMPSAAWRGRSTAPPRPRHRAVRTAALVVGIGAVAAVAALSAARTHDDGWRSVNPGASVLAALDVHGRPGSSLGLRAPATDIAAGQGAAWVSSYDEGTVQRIKIGSDTAAQVTRVGSGATGVAVAGGDVWVANALDDTVARVDAQTQTVVQTIHVGRRPQDVAAAGGSVWISNRGDGTLTRIDARSGTVRGTVRVGPEPSGLAAGPGGVVWAAVGGAGRLLRIDATTGRVEDAVNVGSGPSALALADGSLWVANELDATVSLVDSRTGVVRLTRSVDGTPTALAATPAGVWVAVRDRPTLTHIARSGVRRSSRLPAPATALAADGGRLLVAVGIRGDVHRGGTLRVRWSFPLQSTDPYVCCDAPMNLRALSYDGLLAVAKTPGSPGQLVPDLADAVPRPEDAGRVYRFRLRPGVRYWTGTRVRASDVRRGLERAARTNGAYATDLAALGASACGPRRGCDLSRAVLTDDRAGTVTLRQRRADPDLLTAIAQPTFAPTPPTSGPIPGTGPYRIARFVPGRLLELRRNPFFAASAPAAQPTGAPDRIVWHFGGSPSAAVAAVLRGEADYTFDPPSAEQRADVLLRSPAQLLTVPTPTIAYLALDSRTPPFDDVRVRRAVNFALDRAAIARIWGGAGIATPFCQALPAGLLGHHRFCPYTRAPSRSGHWSGPDLARARRLLAAAPGRHATVEIWGQTGPDGAMARAFGRTLRRLGLHPHVNVGSSGWEAAISDTRHPPQAITQIWGDDSPAQFIGLQLTCNQWSPPARTSNHSRFCDPVVDRWAATAHRLQTTDPVRAARLWHRADVRVTAAAPWVVAVQFNGTELVSRRVRNFRYAPAFGTLIDQLWVR